MENKNKTGYRSPWQEQLQDTMRKILGREKFSFDLAGDALYRQYKDRYIRQGRRAMMDTMGQAQAMTGGYGNSYAAGAGQQAYSGYLQQLGERVPELYRAALDRYTAETEQLRGNGSLLAQLEKQDYDRYRDALADRDSAYEKLVALMRTYRYMPTQEEMDAAGLTEAQRKAILGR